MQKRIDKVLPFIKDQKVDYSRHLSRHHVTLFDDVFLDKATGNIYTSADLRLKELETLRNLTLRPPKLNPRYLTLTHYSTEGRKLLEEHNMVFASQLEPGESPLNAQLTNEIARAYEIFKNSDPSLLLFLIRLIDPKRFSNWFPLYAGGAFLDFHLNELIQSYYDHVANVACIQDPILKRLYRLKLYESFKEFFPLTLSDVDSDLETALRQLNAPKNSDKITYTVDELRKSVGTSVDQFYLVDQVLTQGLFILAAAPKSGKSLLAYHLSYCVASGEKFLGTFKTTKGRVLYIQAEEPEPTIMRRLEDAGFKRSNPRYKEASQNIRIRRHFDLVSDIPSLQKEIDEWKPSLIVFDTLRSITRSSEYSENSVEFGRFVYQLQHLCSSNGICGLLIHHKNKQAHEQTINSVAGSGSIVAASDGVILLEHALDKDHVPCLRMNVQPRDFVPWSGYLYRTYIGDTYSGRHTYEYQPTCMNDPNPVVLSALYDYFDEYNANRDSSNWVGISETDLNSLFRKFIVNENLIQLMFRNLMDCRLLIPGNKVYNEITGQEETIYYSNRYFPNGMIEEEEEESPPEQENSHENSFSEFISDAHRIELAPNVEEAIRIAMRDTTVTPVVYDAAPDSGQFFIVDEGGQENQRFGFFIKNRYLRKEFLESRDARVIPYLVLPVAKNHEVHDKIVEIFKEEVKVGTPSHLNLRFNHLYRHDPKFDGSIEFFLSEMIINGSICAAYILRKFFKVDEVVKRIEKLSPPEKACLKWVDQRLDVFLEKDWPSLDKREIEYYSRNWLRCPPDFNKEEQTLIDILYVISLGAMGSTSRLNFYDVKPPKEMAPLFAPWILNRKLLIPTLRGTNPYHPEQFKPHFLEVWKDEELIDYLYKYAFPENFNGNPDKMNMYARLLKIHHKVPECFEKDIAQQRKIYEQTTALLVNNPNPSSKDDDDVRDNIMVKAVVSHIPVLKKPVNLSSEMESVDVTEPNENQVQAQESENASSKTDSVTSQDPHNAHDSEPSISDSTCSDKDFEDSYGL